MVVSGQLHIPSILPVGRDPGTCKVGGWVGPRASLGTVVNKNLLLPPEIEPRLSGHPASSLVIVPTESLRLFQGSIKVGEFFDLMNDY
jgi:hypothetical protein